MSEPPAPEARIQELEMKVAFLERHVEGIDRAFQELNDQLVELERSVKRLADQQEKSSGPGGEESIEDAVPPHYGPE